MAKTQTPEIKLDVRAYPIKEPKTKTVAFASVTINDMVAINGIQIIDGKNGLFPQMPQTKDASGEYRDIAFPVTKDLRLQLNTAIMDAFTAAKEKVSVKDTIQEGAKVAKGASAIGKGKSSKSKAGPEH